MTTTPDPAEERIVAENLDLIDRLIRQDGLARHYLVDEMRSRANWALFRSARRIACWGMGPGDERRYVASAMLRASRQVRRDFRRRGRTLEPLSLGRESGGIEPFTREAAPDFLAELRESLAAGMLTPRTSPDYRALSSNETDRLRAMIAASPGRPDAAVARDFFAATRIRVHAAAVRYHRIRMGLPPSGCKGGGHLHRKLA